MDPISVFNVLNEDTPGVYQVETPFDITFSISDKKQVIIPKGTSCLCKLSFIPLDDGSTSFMFSITYKKVEYPITFYSTQDEAVLDGWNFTPLENKMKDPDILKVDPVKESLNVTNEQYGYDIKKGSMYYALSVGFIKYNMRLTVVNKNHVEVVISFGDESMFRFTLRTRIVQFLVNVGYIISEASGLKPSRKDSSI